MRVTAMRGRPGFKASRVKSNISIHKHSRASLHRPLRIGKFRHRGHHHLRPRLHYRHRPHYRNQYRYRLFGRPFGGDRGLHFYRPRTTAVGSIAGVTIPLTIMSAISGSALITLGSLGVIPLALGLGLGIGSLVLSGLIGLTGLGLGIGALFLFGRLFFNKR
ncbi:hypothetical protein ACFL2K_02625 [Candidatus Margulisiibacteriota bacterium]